MSRRVVLFITVGLVFLALVTPVVGGGSVDLNRATFQELVGLPGVGPVIAERILQYRKQHGGFQTVDELLEIKGIGPKKLQAIRPLVRVSPRDDTAGQGEKGSTMGN